jgi:hypothetical protein
LGGVIAVIVAVAPPAARGAGDEPATRPEALAACITGCDKQVASAANLTRQQKRTVCDESCNCMIDAMFERDGRKKQPPFDVPKIAASCAEKAKAKAGIGAPAPAPEVKPAAACAREMKPADLEKLLAQCRQVAQPGQPGQNKQACDSTRPCAAIKADIIAGCAKLEGRVAPRFCAPAPAPK